MSERPTIPPAIAKLVPRPTSDFDDEVVGEQELGSWKPLSVHVQKLLMKLQPRRRCE
jgi:hypothetical protein